MNKCAMLGLLLIGCYFRPCFRDTCIITNVQRSFGQPLLGGDDWNVTCANEKGYEFKTTIYHTTTVGTKMCVEYIKYDDHIEFDFVDCNEQTR